MSATPVSQLIELSPFLSALARRYEADLAGDPGQLLDDVCNKAQSGWRDCETDNEIKTLLRNTRNRAALIIARADLAKTWSLEEVTRQLTRVADTCVNTALNWLLAEAAGRGQIELADAENPAHGCGYFMLAMGKHGGHELNFSSDIDLIALYDADVAPLADSVEPASFFVRLTRRFVSLIQDITNTGYAYRVDLRLRPDPRATQVAISVDAALFYYESMGQNWERAAMIKARVVAGDKIVGKAFLDELKPFIWRKYLDFAAIAEVHSLKRQIHAVKGHGEITILGHNVKLGRGGIREIEFFVQTQQLIAGGRNPQLRSTYTLEMLDLLADAKWIEPDAASALKDDYRFLRTIEHRIQMLEDEQTHVLPDSDEKFDHFAKFCDAPDAETLSIQLLKTFERVQANYDRLFAEEGDEEGESLNFFGPDEDEQTIARLAALGFSNPQTVSATINAWYAGRYRAMRSKVARERLKELLPELINALAQSADPDATLAAFDRFVAGLPTGIQLFSLLRSNPQILDLITTILSSAPKLANTLSGRPKILDAVLDPDFFSRLPDRTSLNREINAFIPGDRHYDQVLDDIRIFAREQMFSIGVRTLTDTTAGAITARAYSDLAGAIIERLLQAALSELKVRHGEVEGGRICVVGMGKLGGYEMTATSDLDLIVIYDHAEDATFSNGPKQISSSQFYTRLTQRLITALTSPTAEGELYEVDMRLRPSGNKGPVATRISSFMSYQQNEAWTWEQLALTRARVVAGDKSLANEINDAIQASLTLKREQDKVRKDAAEMRHLMASEKPGQGVWDLKLVRGGIVDVEFITQVLQITYAANNNKILSTNTSDALARLVTAGIITAEHGETLTRAAQTYLQIAGILKIGIEGVFDPDTSPAGLLGIVKAAFAAPDIATCEATLADLQASVFEIYQEIIGA